MLTTVILIDYHRVACVDASGRCTSTEVSTCLTVHHMTTRMEGEYSRFQTEPCFDIRVTLDLQATLHILTE